MICGTAVSIDRLISINNKKVSYEGLLGGGGLKYFETSISKWFCRVG